MRQLSLLCFMTAGMGLFVGGYENMTGEMGRNQVCPQFWCHGVGLVLALETTSDMKISGCIPGFI